ncbi:hypothetical protein [Nitrosomonas halophila]|jgi:hypothetical protein|uniref:Cytochrome C Planctomycete-type domain-containing protein n=1 Tax=Nitrosomonas halophila TaxID=44576 RepID=A0A1H3C330_9PROT|nr:hypothetical protein [Nitrosomonas halophila]SDX48573.1 hypothetical protein SAMN05421881_100247 [Nitrosomonas halophila]
MKIYWLLTALHATPALAAEMVTYEADIAPILQARCVICHSAGRLRPPLGLKLDSLEGMFEGSQNGPIVRANDRRQPGRSGNRIIRTVDCK